MNAKLHKDKSLSSAESVKHMRCEHADMVEMTT